MCDTIEQSRPSRSPLMKTVPVTEAVGMVLAHDVTEIRKDEFKGAAFRKGHIVREEDVCRLQRLGKERLFVLSLGPDDMHEDEAAYAIANALMGEGVAIQAEPREGKINIIASRDGLLTIDREALASFNMLGEVMCATLHRNSIVTQGRIVAGTRAIPLVIKRSIVEEAVRLANAGRSAECGVRDAAPPQPPLAKGGIRGGVIEVRELRRPRAGVVITGNEVYHGRVKDAFGEVITRKIEDYGGEVVNIFYAPDDERFIEDRLRELLEAGADLLITTGGMSVDPDDVTRFAIRNLGATDITYGSAVLPGAMVLVGYIESAERGVRSATLHDRETEGRGDGESMTENEVSPRRPVTPSPVPILGIPACGMYHKTTVFDLLLPRVLAGEMIGRRELAELGHGGLCLHCKECRYPVCPFGK